MAPVDDLWHYPRAELARQIMGMFDTGLASALTFFAPRRMGKTEFLRKDITPLAQAAGWRVFYFSFLDAGQNSQAQFTQALDAFATEKGLLARLAQPLTHIGKVSGEAAGIKGELEMKQDATQMPDLLQVMERLAKGKQPVLLLLDEIQALASKAHAGMIATLRTALDMHKDKIKVIFTGSSREGLRRMFSSSTAPFFHFGQNLELPELGRGFTDHLADIHQQATGRILNKDDLWQAFMDMQRVPQFARSLVERLTLNPYASIGAVRAALMVDLAGHRDFSGLWQDMTPLERAIMKALATSTPELYSQNFRQELAATFGLDDISTTSIQNAIRALQRQSLIHKQGQGVYVIEDPLFADWIAHE